MKRTMLAAGVVALAVLPALGTADTLQLGSPGRGTTDVMIAPKGKTPPIALSGPDDLPAGLRGWNVIPSVIRDNADDPVMLEVDVNGPVNRVTINSLFEYMVGPASPPFDLHDDGLNGDRVQGDFIFTGGPFYRNMSYPVPTHYMNDLNSPEGLHAIGISSAIVIEETNATLSQLLLEPQVGVLRSDIPAVQTSQLSSDVVVSPHLINVKTDARLTQRFLRFWPDADLSDLSMPIYQVLPDKIHEFVLFSTNHLERTPWSHATNFNAGVHGSVRVDYTGTGLGLFDSSSLYGSQGVLLAFNALDIHRRGAFANNLMHEISHTWAAYWNTSLGLTNNTAHWNGLNNFASMLGGYQWTSNPDGSYTIDCSIGLNQNYSAPPVERYLAGFLDGSSVPTLRALDPNGPSAWSRCQNQGGHVDPADIAFTYSIADIQAVHGVREPGPATSLKNFVLGFVAESHDRFLTPTEMTYYDILADHATNPVAVGAPDPLLAENWPPITRYWGPGVTWRSRLYTDADHDSILDDGDSSQVDFDHPCTGGATQNCDDNCPSVANAGQADADSDGIGNDCDPPLAPTNLTATSGTLRVDLAWTAPTNTGGNPLTWNGIWRRIGAVGSYTLMDYAVGSATTYTDTAVNAGQLYYYQVTALTAVGTSPLSNEASATPTSATPPSAPGNFTEVTGNARVDLSWTTPGSNGGSAITSYRVYRSTNNVNFTLLGSGGCANLGVVLTCGDTTALNNTKYYYRAHAVNAAGEGAASTVVSLTPSVPASVSAQHNGPANSGKIKVTWTAPVNNGGSAVTNYKVYQSTDNTHFGLVTSGGCENLGNVSNCTRTGLTQGVTYYFKVSAVNSVGEGPKSTPSASAGG